MATSELLYDRQTGQVFTQKIIPVLSMVPAWLKKSKGTKIDPIKYRHRGLGTSSLYDTALRTCAWHIELFDPAFLVDAEWPYAEKIYKQLKRRDALTLKSWSLFRKAFPLESSIDHTFTLYIFGEAHSSPLELIPLGKHLTLSLHPATLTHLNLLNLAIRDTHLMQLLDMPCLSSLFLEQSRTLSTTGGDDGGISDSFLKRWGRAVAEVNAFLHLKIVVFRNFQAGLHASLICFATFPQLALMNLDSWVMRRDINALRNGRVVDPRWRHLVTDGSNAHLREKNPEITWKRSDKTIHEKMNMLYDLASNLTVNPQRHHDASEAGLKPSTVSISYGDARRYDVAKSYSTWFVRAPCRTSDEECSSLPGKRPLIESRGAERGTPTRQPVKKVKSGKKQDIGALLGAFG